MLYLKPIHLIIFILKFIYIRKLISTSFYVFISRLLPLAILTSKVHTEPPDLSMQIHTYCWQCHAYKVPNELLI